MSTASRCRAAPQGASPLSDLHNTSHIPSTVPLVVHLPPFAPIPGKEPHLPDFLAPFPTAVINYRWTGPSSLTSSHTEPSTQDEFKAPLHWPTPLHDVLFAYSWLLKNLRPENQARRAIYLHGTYLGATLAAALALTECHKHEATAVRGLAAYKRRLQLDHVLPDHKLNKPTTYRGKTTPVPPPRRGLGTARPAGCPARPVRCAGVAVRRVREPEPLLSDGGPRDPAVVHADGRRCGPRRQDGGAGARGVSGRFDACERGQDAEAQRAAVIAAATTSSTAKRKTTSVRKRKAKGNQFEAQAQELAGLLRRSMEKLELKERMKWDEDFDAEGEMEARVKVVDVGDGSPHELGARGDAVVREWLKQRIAL
ncbi:conserved hypothetical protein [Verticillium alfalfae VaMs.102]|uniref:Alpha/beta hydrolase fold-3 domain-containing protein n=1 Tax=Verticillium alfalfae (strain VaMs.102 / ATCC MYA-4576 / FGSC 10136) TaxID=526221 RepID=C9SSM5_VERA1|nr:conserved hypothetical protein [Verticillium alfalfae VaMs.102]EEY21790.1 conserved hypothetical protein [Verticillium alfalfae VaMs.102]